MKKKATLEKTPCVYVLRNMNKSNSTYVGYTNDLKGRLHQHNGEIKGGSKATRNGKWIPVLAVTGFLSKKDATSFELSAKQTAKKKEFDEYATLYQGRCPPSVVKRILAARCLLCEQDKWWTGPKNKRHYVIHWGKGIRDAAQAQRLKNNWGRIGRLVTHTDMDLEALEIQDVKNQKKKLKKLKEKVPVKEVIVISSDEDEMEHKVEEFKEEFRKNGPDDAEEERVNDEEVYEDEDGYTLPMKASPFSSTSSSSSSKASSYRHSNNGDFADDEENEDDLGSIKSDNTMMDSDY
ncbi:hypothetical protein G9A89_022454 [Geosiphon pyriformis]|nr:hypothetical protein G9A89_022454 [Geosiphon pyriformis]